MSLAVANRVTSVRMTPALLHLCVGAGIFLFLFIVGDRLLHDSDTYWHIKVGQWIIDHAAMPYSDIYSFTRAGSPWMSNAWLSQVIYATAYSHAGWAGAVALTALAVAAALVIFLNLIGSCFEPVHRILLALLAFVVSSPHLLARPHVLALPIMVAWAGGLIRAVDQRSPPPWVLLPLMVVWANLHGGFVLGLALIAPIALEALWQSKHDERIAVATQWGLFGVAALLASCCTPYLHNTLFAAAKILSLGPVLSLVSEWRPADFSSIGPFELALLGLIGLALSRGVVLSLPRIALLLLVTHMALSHVRCVEVFAFLVPLAIARPFRDRAAPAIHAIDARASWLVSTPAALAVIGGALALSLAYTAHHDFVFDRAQAPAAALDALRQHQARRIFNDYQFGGFLIANDVPTFIDSRAELYGQQFMMKYLRAAEGRSRDEVAALLDEFKVDGTLLTPDQPAAQLLDQMPGWTRLYADDFAVAHVRVAPAK
ncbi:hypothetical protein S58_15400 [Bradyrhizobium oligotrophicum S58]|uniref:Glycosyltransferase RgtA/B/C/D-like domain-containing protein n=1 Tax=Bradyrhizobium oligotrophicum S58 TaxID=1245469 RepID=M4Z2R5_9BRAD|nr:hypothetical protein [Bradyrhizobium oligotrophicum]BAM87548.1 hypothetical protein S58_15400 [Bradyrhizobium oligotrophicum S58]